MTKKEEEFWKLAQEMLAKKDFSRIKELEELNEQHKRINGELRQENKQLKEELAKADSITQSCIFIGAKQSGLSYRKSINMIDKLTKENKKLKDNWNKLKEIIKEQIDNPLNIEFKMFSKMVLRDMEYLENGDSNE